MAGTVSKDLVRAFYEARVACDPVRLSALMDDDIEWWISGPVDALRYAGQRRGKQTVIDALIAQGKDIFRIRDVIIDEIVVDGDTAMTHTRIAGVHAVTGRAISYQCAQLLRYRDGKLVLFRAIIDSFDATEQVLGREIGLVGQLSNGNVRPALSRPLV